MSSFSDKINQMVWSYSRISAFKQCKYAFYLQYLLKDFKDYPQEDNFYAESGSYVHKILEMVFSGELKSEDAYPYYVEHFDDAITCKVKPSILENTYEACADYLDALDLSKLSNYEILGVEQEIETEIEGYRFTGFIDLLLRNKKTGKIVLVDHKSAKYPFKSDGSVLKNSKSSFYSYKKQMYLYAHAVNEKYGQFPTIIAWNHFKNGKIAQIKFKKSDYQKEILWFIKTIHEIENEEEFPAKKDYFYCHNLCSFRNSCEYVNMKD